MWVRLASNSDSFYLSLSLLSCNLSSLSSVPVPSVCCSVSLLPQEQESKVLWVYAFADSVPLAWNHFSSYLALSTLLFFSFFVSRLKPEAYGHFSVAFLGRQPSGVYSTFCLCTYTFYFSSVLVIYMPAFFSSLSSSFHPFLPHFARV